VDQQTGDYERVIAERAARNQSTYRDANERISAAAGSRVEPLPFICECSDIGCTMIIRLRSTEYDAVRADGARFCVAPGHDVCAIRGVEVARVVERRPGFTVMEKVGRAGVLARELDAERAEERHG
jgi:hypothetical protein